jgi:hypothetical protein
MPRFSFTALTFFILVFLGAFVPVQKQGTKHSVSVWVVCRMWWTEQLQWGLGSSSAMHCMVMEAVLEVTRYPSSPPRKIYFPFASQSVLNACMHIMHMHVADCTASSLFLSSSIVFPRQGSVCWHRVGQTQHFRLSYKAEKQRKGKSPNSGAAKTKSDQNHSNRTTAPSRQPFPALFARLW